MVSEHVCVEAARQELWRRTSKGKEKGSGPVYEKGPVASWRTRVPAVAVLFASVTNRILFKGYCSVTRNGPTPSTKIITGHRNNVDRRGFDFLRRFHEGP